MEKKWNLQDIKPAERRRPSKPVSRAPEAAARTSAEEPVAKRRPAVSPRGDRRSKAKLWVVLGIVILIAIGGIAFTSLTGKTSVTVFPRWREPTVNAIFEANKEATTSAVAYEVLMLEAEGEREVTATGQENVEEQATGKLTVYKTTPGSERLIKNTRFESSDGHIYRITESVEVPGSTAAGAGSVTASIFADQTGPEYNLDAGQRFTVPGFKESGLTDLYNAIYAENAEAISGGHKGPKFIIDDSELQSATESLHTELQEALQKRIATEKPAGFVAFDNSVRFGYQSLPAEDLGNGKVKIKEKATLYLPLFKNEDFASFIAAATIPGYESEPVRIENVDTLTFEYVGEPALAEAHSFSFKLLGKPKVIWSYDTDKLKQDLAGGSQTALNTVLGGYPAIEKATATIKPFWRRSFPDDPAKITVIEELSTE